MDAATKAERSAQVHEEMRKRKKEERAEVGEDDEEEDLVPVVSTYLAPRAAGSLGFQQIFS
jgi:hypothetical protein